jgi:hypothetical protein
MADFAIVGSDLPEAGCGPQICLDKSNGRTKHAIKSSFFWFFCEWLKAKRLRRRREAFIARLRVLSMRRYALTLTHVYSRHAHFCTGNIGVQSAPQGLREFPVLLRMSLLCCHGSWICERAPYRSPPGPTVRSA